RGFDRREISRSGDEVAQHAALARLVDGALAALVSAVVGEAHHAMRGTPRQHEHHQHGAAHSVSVFHSNPEIVAVPSAPERVSEAQRASASSCPTADSSSSGENGFGTMRRQGSFASCSALASFKKPVTISTGSLG